MDPKHSDATADRIGRLISTVFIVLLAAFFIYGYLGRWLF
jgi:hypothetical protein